MDKDILIFDLKDLDTDNTLTDPEELTPKYKVKVTCSQLRRRRAPNLQGEVVDLITDQGVYEIYDEVNGWGQLKDGNWIMLIYT